MTIPAGMTDIFPAFSLGAVALLKLMARIDPPPAIRWSVVGGLMLLLVLYLVDRLHLYLPDRVGLPFYGGLTIISIAILWWNYRTTRPSKRI